MVPGKMVGIWVYGPSCERGLLILQVILEEMLQYDKNRGLMYSNPYWELEWLPLARGGIDLSNWVHGRQNPLPSLYLFGH
jgi:hypothetical protein